MRVLTLFGTRPEVIKLAPVIRELEAAGEFTTVNVHSGQHEGLAQPFVEAFGIRVDHDLRVMRPCQTPSDVCSRVLDALDGVLVREAPDAILVQGDTTTALAGALCAFHARIPVGHVEAGLRSGNDLSPHPEEMNRRLITRLATWHFAATELNRENLLREGVADAQIFVTGNPVVDSVQRVYQRLRPGRALQRVQAEMRHSRILVLTTHRRESFGEAMMENLRVLRRFVNEHPDVGLVFPVHPNPTVVSAARSVLSDHPRVLLIEPLGYEDFIALLSAAWLVVSDSGGIQEEAPSVGRPLLILRENTERPEAVSSGVARLVGGCPERLAAMLEEAASPGSWAETAGTVANPFGRGDAGIIIARTLRGLLRGRSEPRAYAPEVGPTPEDS